MEPTDKRKRGWTEVCNACASLRPEISTSGQILYNDKCANCGCDLLPGFQNRNAWRIENIPIQKK